MKKKALDSLGHPATTWRKISPTDHFMALLPQRVTRQSQAGPHRFQRRGTAPSLLVAVTMIGVAMKSFPIVSPAAVRGPSS